MQIWIIVLYILTIVPVLTKSNYPTDLQVAVMLDCNNILTFDIEETFFVNDNHETHIQACKKMFIILLQCDKQ